MPCSPLLIHAPVPEELMVRMVPLQVMVMVMMMMMMMMMDAVFVAKSFDFWRRHVNLLLIGIWFQWGPML